MAAAMNGMTLHGGLIPAGATFLVFTDYCRPAIRLAALMGIRVIYVMTHDSIGLGEDGPTHQPVEHLAALRAIPNLIVFRPADPVETAECWQLALRTRTRPEPARADAPEPVAVPHGRRARATCSAARRLRDSRPPRRRGQGERSSPRAPRSRSRSPPQALLAERGDRRRASSPCPASSSSPPSPPPTRAAVIGDAPVKVAVEAGIRMGWDAIIGSRRRLRRHDRLRRQRALQGALRAFRHHGRSGRGGGRRQALTVTAAARPGRFA